MEERDVCWRIYLVGGVIMGGVNLILFNTIIKTLILIIL